MKRSKINLSHYRLFTCDMGLLIPITWYEALPGDTIQQSTASLLRVSPLLSPVMHPVRVRIHHWFVPNRLLWDGFEDFITGGKDGNNNAVPPYVLFNDVGEGSLADYLGIPTGNYASRPLEVSALPFRAYQLIYNEMYRDQDLVVEVPIIKSDGADSITNQTIYPCAWEKDYFTTSRPWEQKGASVVIPIGDQAPIRGIGVQEKTGWTGPVSVFETGGVDTQYTMQKSTSSNNVHVEEDPLHTGYPGIYADLSAATGIDVNDLRLALAIQRYKEARAQFGSRYVEYLRYLGVRSSDARLQLPEYLGGGKQVIQFSEVLKTGSVEDPSEPIGALKGHGISGVRTSRYRRFFEEHGIVLSLMSVLPKTVYTSTLHKKWSRKIKEDYFQKELQFLGDQPVLNKEVQAAHTEPNGVFGYNTRYDDYRHIPSGVSGEFRSTLNYWHYGREFSGDVGLNASFINANPTKRVYASTNTHCLYVMTSNKVVARRMMAKTPVAKTF